MNPADAYSELVAHVRQSALLKSTMSLLDWDQQTKLPAAGGAWRSEQLTFLAGELHRRETQPRVGELLGVLRESDWVVDAGPQAVANVRELSREYDKQKKLPPRLVEAMARAASTGQQTWVMARKENDFERFLPCLEETFSLKREYADAVGFPDCRYDALLDDYEPGALTRDIAPALAGIREGLVSLLQEVAGSERGPKTAMLHRDYPIADQERLARLVVRRIGFDFQRGRLDETHHPFCDTMGPSDVRLATRYDSRFFNTAFFGSLHEAGHGIYEQGLPADQFGLPAGSWCSLGIHESQSRLWENLVARSRAFWDHFFPIVQSLFPAALEREQAAGFFAAVNEVRPSLIRVEADELTYNLHILVRFELERALVENELRPRELPDAWNSRYRELLGIEPETDADGVLQDVHWSAGLVGYFPTYSLGNLYASQLFEAAERELGDLADQFQRGEFVPLREWLNRQVHSRGRTLNAPELNRLVTGAELTQEPLMRHLRAKVNAVYDL